jgi:hypothetical protein
MCKKIIAFRLELKHVLSENAPDAVALQMTAIDLELSMDPSSELNGAEATRLGKLAKIS